MKLSVVTIIYNDARVIAKTIRSVLELNYNNMEYILIDGGSTDGSLEIINQYKACFIAKKIELVIISEPDDGIYYAMNKGIDCASGDLINFLNAGDTFNDSFDINKLFENKISENIYFGKSKTYYKNYFKIRYEDFQLNKKNWYYHNLPNHQAVFIPSRYYKKNKFNTDLNVSADTLLMRKAFSELNYICSDQIISNFELGGVSNFYGSWKNLLKVLNDIKFIEADLFKRNKLRLNHIIKYMLQVIFGKDFYLKFYIKYVLK